VTADVLIVLFFLGVGAFFAGAEIALVSLRESQVRALAEQGGRGARAAKLVANPTRFLAAVQVGVTLAGFLSAAFGAARFAGRVTPLLRNLGLGHGAAEIAALVLVTFVLTFLSIVLSELTPKRLAMQHPERWARFSAPFLDRFASVTRPFIWLLSKSTNAVLRLLRGDPKAGGGSITEEELRGLVAAHESLTREERRLIDEVFEAGDRQVREVMIPRTECQFLDASLPLDEAMKTVADAPHSRYPVIAGSSDDVVGFLHVRDLFTPDSRHERVGQLARPVKVLPATKKVIPALSELRREGHHLAVIIDEYGGTAGIVTLEDLIEELIGEIRDEYDVDDAQARVLGGGDREVDGLLNLGEFREQTGIELPDGPYETVAGFVVSRIGRVPRVGDVVETEDVRLHVTELDGRRIARVRVTRVGARGAARPPEDAGPPEAPDGAPVAGHGGMPAHREMGETLGS
jgi:putative hemolysin